MSVKVLVVGDLHIKPCNVADTRVLKNDILNAVHEHDPDIVVVLGDTLHRHNIIDLLAKVEAEQFFDELSAVRYLVLLIGNHDMISPNSYLTTVHPFNALKKWENVRVIDTTTTFAIGDARFTAVPYVPPGRFVEALGNCPEWKSSRAIFAHQEFLGSNMDGVKSRVGDIWEKDNPLVISGHIHQYQKVGSNIIYVGTPRQTSVADGGDKSFSLFTFDNEGGYVEKRIYSSVQPLVEIISDVTKLESIIIPPGRTVKVVLKGSRSQNATLRKHPLVKAWRAAGITVDFKIEFRQEATKTTEVNRTGVDPTNVRYTEFMEILLTRIGKDETKLSILNEIK